jgi:Winged helix DNA-binding domain
VGDETLSLRALNRATLARQLLLRRAELSVPDAIEHLVGLQAQVPHNPYTGLWSRLAGFRPEVLSKLIESRHVVRIGVMRGTIHLVTAGDCLLLRPLMQPVFEGQLWRHREHAPALRELDLEPVVELGRSVLEERPRNGTELRMIFAERFPGLDPAALVYACQMRLGLVQPPPRGLWGRNTQVTWTTAEAWLGSPPVAAPSLDDVVLRYLAAFGPASTADVTTWCRLTGLREVVERLRPRLRTFRDERGRELFDLPDAPHPDPGTPAPPRFLPEYDNVLLSHADRRRFVDDRARAALGEAWELGWGGVLHDGLLRAVWRVRENGLVVRHVGLPKRAQATVAAEGRRLLRFLGSKTREVRLERVSP